MPTDGPRFTGTRFTRFSCVADPPPYIDKIERLLRKAARGRGFVSSDPKEVRGIAQTASKFYEDKGKADDVMRFFRNVGVLLDDPVRSRSYVDFERLDHVLACCEAHRDPGPNLDPVQRLAELKSRAALAPTPEPEPETEPEPIVVEEPPPAVYVSEPEPPPLEDERPTIPEPIRPIRTPEPPPPVALPQPIAVAPAVVSVETLAHSAEAGEDLLRRLQAVRSTR